jgi:DNA polymerase III alpha subunit (gram-positive type)
MLRAFNGECDAAVSKVRYNNVSTMEKRIQKSFDAINKLGKINKCEISDEYYSLKLKELQLTHEYREKKQEEQEEQRFLKEQMREEQKALQELEKARKAAEKEEEQYQKALEKARKEFAGVSKEDQEKLQAEINELEQKLKEAEQRSERAKSRAQMTRSGYVYVISNIGSFGENIYKIGMTRREDPDVRVRELSGASVPFPFDIHAQIWSEDAPGLESKLHQFFSDRRLNKANERKEFFKVSLDEIEATVNRFLQDDPESKISLHFTKIAEAEEYRKTIQLG